MILNQQHEPNQNHHPEPRRVQWNPLVLASGYVAGMQSQPIIQARRNHETASYTTPVRMVSLLDTLADNGW